MHTMKRALPSPQSSERTGHAREKPEGTEQAGCIFYRNGKVGFSTILSDGMVDLMKTGDNLALATVASQILLKYSISTLFVNGDIPLEARDSLERLCAESKCKAEFKVATDFSSQKGASLVRDSGVFLPHGVSIAQLLAEYQESLACSGLLLSHFHKISTGNLPSALPQKLEMVRLFSLSGCLLLDHDTILALQLTERKRHPRAHSYHDKEGLSIWHLLDCCKTERGSKLLKSRLLQPSTVDFEINQRLETIDLLMQLEAADGILTWLGKVIGKVRDMRLVFARLATAPTYSEVKAILDSCTVVEQLKERFMGGKAESLFFEALFPQLEDFDFQKVSTDLQSTVDFATSAQQKKIVISEDCCEELYQIYAEYRELPDVLELLSERTKSEFPQLPGISIVYQAPLGYAFLIEDCVDMDRFPGFQAIDGTRLYVNQELASVNNFYGSLKTEISDLEIQIIHRLTDELLAHRSTFYSLNDGISQLDCYYALTQSAISLHLCRPQLETNFRGIEATGCRHLLQELQTHHFVSNPINHTPDFQYIITGPNCSGKSVYVKQIALMVILAQSGSYVPAEYCRLGIFDKIFTRIRSNESLVTNQSSFYVDLIQLESSITNSIGNSLILIDEFGKGTCMSDAIGLLIGVIEHFSQKPGANRPLVVYITHFYEIYSHLPKPVAMNVKWLHMNCSVDVKSKIRFLFTISEGMATQSFGINCARLARIPEPLVSRAETLSRCFMAFEPVEPKNVENSLKNANAVISLYLALLKETDSVSVGRILREIESHPIIDGGI